MSADQDPDIVEVILAACKEAGLDPGVAYGIENRIRAEYGGLRVRIPKRKKHPTAEARDLVVADAFSSMSTEEITIKHSISRATLYRMIKKSTP